MCISQCKLFVICTLRYLNEAKTSSPVHFQYVVELLIGFLSAESHHVAHYRFALVIPTYSNGLLRTKDTKCIYKIESDSPCTRPVT